MATRIRVLSVDAWRDADGGWTWNNWHALADATINGAESTVDAPIGFLALNRHAWDAGLGKRGAVRAFLAALREAGFIGSRSKGAVTLDGNGLGDPLTISVCQRSNGMPFLAVEIKNTP